MLLDRLEQKINKGNDTGWRPLKSFYPPKNVKQDWSFFRRIWMPYILFLIIVGDLAISIAWVVPVGLSPAVPHFALYFLSVFLSSMILYSPLLATSCLVILPYIWAWNRRAARLQKEPEPIPDASSEADPEGVWPPAPRR